MSKIRGILKIIREKMKIKMNLKIVICHHNKFRWKHNNHKIKANKKTE